MEESLLQKLERTQRADGVTGRVHQQIQRVHDVLQNGRLRREAWGREAGGFLPGISSARTQDIMEERADPNSEGDD